MPLHGGLADLHHAPQSEQGLVIDLFSPEQLGVVAEIAQKPAQLPQGLGGAVQAAGHEAPGQFVGFEDGEARIVIGLLLVPAILGPIDPDQEQPVRNSVAGRLGQSRSKP